MSSVPIHHSYCRFCQAFVDATDDEVLVLKAVGSVRQFHQCVGDTNKSPLQLLFTVAKDIHRAQIGLLLAARMQ